MILIQIFIIDTLVTKRCSNKVDDAVDSNYTLWSVANVLQSTCKHKYGIELDVANLKTQLKKCGFKRIRRPSKNGDSRISSFLPKDFDNIYLPKVKDTKNDNQYRFRINIQETNFDNEFKREIDQDKHIIYETDRKNRVLVVIHMCKSDNHEFYICVDKHAIDNHAFSDNPKITKCTKHCLYKIIIKDHNFSTAVS